MKRIPCKTPFSNGMEFEMFLELCESECKRYRNGKCKIINLCYKAMFDMKYFPYGELLDWDNGCGGKGCRSFTTETAYYRRRNKQCKGQYELF